MLNEVQELIQQLKELQLQQADIIARLEEAREKENKTEVGGQVTADQTNTTPATVIETREIAIGDKVNIKNPNPFQQDNGTVIKIGKSRITVQTRTGGKILRAAKNLSLRDE